MSDSSEKLKRPLDLRGLDPRKEFFLATTAGNRDGSLDEIEGEYQVHDTLDEAVTYLLDTLDDCLLDGYVFHCVPVRYVGRGPLRVRPLKDSPIEQLTANRKKTEKEK